MIALARFALILIAAIDSINAVIAWCSRMETDCYVFTLVAILALAGVFLIDYLQHEYRRLMASYRAQVWRNREARP